jgi:L-arabinose isomerase
VDEWCRQGPTHHCALGVGHLRGAIEKVAELMDLPFAAVC